MSAVEKVLEGSPPDIQDLFVALRSDNPLERERARNKLTILGREAIVPLIRELKSPIVHARWEAAKALSQIRDVNAANALAEVMDDENHDVRWVASQGLVRLGAKGLEQTLLALLSHGNSIWVRDSAHHVLSHFAHRMGGEYLLPLLALFNGFEPAVSVPPAALTALHTLQKHNNSAAPKVQRIKSN
ncbi:MAG TPA: HEAT repeat domain-containing protein [Pirellulales bacterium]|nr:HEAT repeat domain-containing protein [Pirellulales bacterium]